MPQPNEVWGSKVRLRFPEFTPEEEERYQRFLDVWEWVGTKGLTSCPYGKAEDVLDFAGCWWKRRKVPRNRCTALVPVGFWGCPSFGKAGE